VAKSQGPNAPPPPKTRGMPAAVSWWEASVESPVPIGASCVASRRTKCAWRENSNHLVTPKQPFEDRAVPHHQPATHHLILTPSTMQEESLQPITVGAFYGLQCPRPFLLACEKPPIEEGPEIRKPPSLKDSPYCALAGQNSVFLGKEPRALFATATLRG
jgi:hypothetical protein